MNVYIKNIFSIIKWLLLLLILLAMIILASNLWVEYQTKDRLYSDVDTIPAKNVALLLGTSKRLRYRRINRYFKYRIDAVVKLYKAGKIKHIIASGDNRTVYHNEPVDMQNSLMEQGIPKEAISLDYAGFRTLDSIVRCKEIFSQDDIIIVSQAFHNKRAIFISDYYGIKAIGFNARDLTFSEGKKVVLREYFARFKAILDLYVLKTKPKFLGEKVEIPD
jgi:SanA protein